MTTSMSEPSPLTERAVVQVLQKMDPPAITTIQEFRGELTLTVPAARILGICDTLLTHPTLRFDLLVDVTAVDRYPLEPRFEVVYHLRSMQRGERVRLKALLPGDDPRIDSVCALWPVADMLEREVYDLFGVHFNGHPNLRRLLMPDEWEGHPLRKDYPIEGER